MRVTMLTYKIEWQPEGLNAKIVSSKLVWIIGAVLFMSNKDDG